MAAVSSDEQEQEQLMLWRDHVGSACSPRHVQGLRDVVVQRENVSGDERKAPFIRQPWTDWKPWPSFVTGCGSASKPSSKTLQLR